MTTANNDLITGDDDTILVVCNDLNPDGTPATLTPISGTVTAILMRGGQKIAPAVSWTCLSSTPGADWANRIVAIPIAPADTDALSSTARDVIVEVKIVSGAGKPKRYHTPLESAIKIIKKGH